jgi:protein phosphatase
MASKMGSTVVIWMRAGDAWHGAWVGDSRLYHWQHQQLRQITKDHSLAQRMLDSGEAEPGVDVEAHYGHVLTQGLGLRQPLDPGYCSGGCESSGQRFLLCSDGLSDMVDDEKISAALCCADLDEGADRLIGDALDMGGRDNISLILIEP